MNYNLEKTGEILRGLRETRRWTQEGLAQKLGVHSKTIGKAERGVNGVSVDLLIAYADLFAVSLDYLVGRKTERNKELELVELTKQCSSYQLHTIIEMIKAFLHIS